MHSFFYFSVFHIFLQACKDSRVEVVVVRGEGVVRCRLTPTTGWGGQVGASPYILHPLPLTLRLFPYTLHPAPLTPHP